MYPDPPEPNEDEIEAHIKQQDAESLKVSLSVDVPVIHPDAVLRAIADKYIDTHIRPRRGGVLDCVEPDKVRAYVKERIDKTIDKHIQGAIRDGLNAQIDARATSLLDDGWEATDQYGQSKRTVTLKSLIIEWMNGKSGDYHSQTRLAKLLEDKLRETVSALFSEKGVFFSVLADAKKKLSDEVDASLKERMRKLLADTLGRF